MARSKAMDWNWIPALGNLLLFVPLFLLLLLLGIIKGIGVLPVALLVVCVGNIGVVLGLWPAFVYWTYECIFKTKNLAASLKIVAAMVAPIALVLSPALVIVGSVLLGLGYGFFAPLVATFEAVGRGRSEKLKGSITDGVWSTVKGCATSVRDFTDLCYHSFPGYLADFRDQDPVDGPYTIRLVEIPLCFVAAVVGVMVDVPLFGLISVVKSPVMLVKGWQRQLQDLVVSRDGTIAKAVCVPFAGLAILLWPLGVAAAINTAILASFFVGLYAAVVVHKEQSFKRGLAYTVSMVAEFDEYTNDMLYLREGSCFPRPRYSSKPVETPTVPSARSSFFMPREKPQNDVPQLAHSKSLKQTIQEVKMFQVWEHTFTTCEKYAKELIQEGVLSAADLEAWLRSNERHKDRLVGIGLPSYAMLKNLIISANAGSTGLILHNGVELTSFNRPQDRLLDWLFDPLLVLKEQIRVAQLQPSEVRFLEKITLLPPEASWDNGGSPPEDNMRRAELEAISRRIQGIMKTTTRFPTSRRRYENFIKSLLAYAQQLNSSNTKPLLLPAAQAV